MSTIKKPLVVALGDPKYAGDDFLNDFKKDFDFEVFLADPFPDPNLTGPESRYSPPQTDKKQKPFFHN